MLEVNRHFIDYQQQFKRSWGTRTRSVNDIQQIPRSWIATKGQDRYNVPHTLIFRWKTTTPTARQTNVLNLYNQYITLGEEFKLWLSAYHVFFATKEFVFHYLYLCMTDLWFNDIIAVQRFNKKLCVITRRIFDKINLTMSTRFKNSSKISCLLDVMLRVFKHT